MTHSVAPDPREDKVDPTTYEFIILKTEFVDIALNVYCIGVSNPIINRPWAFTFGPPKCFVTFSTSQFTGDKPEIRALVCPMYGDGQNPNTEPFLQFFHHSDSYDVSDWLTSIKENNSFVQGVQVKRTTQKSTSTTVC